MSDAIIGPRYVVAFKRFDEVPAVGALACAMTKEQADWVQAVLNLADPPNLYCAVHEFDLEGWKEQLR